MKYNNLFSSQLKLFSVYILVYIVIIGCNNTNAIALDEMCTQTPKYSETFELPKGLIGYNNYELALDCAKKTNRSLAIYFTGFACVNCKYFERDFLYQDEVKEMLNENFIIAVLYVDDKRELPEEDQVEVTSNYSNQSRVVRTVGHLNVSLTNKYHHSSHPSLFIATNSEEIISFIQYNPDESELLRQLEEAILKSKD
ncbi:MAG: thioredoxin-related protein [Polaribacter sp.]|jgi:thioredoxin-related protein